MSDPINPSDQQPDPFAHNPIDEMRREALFRICATAAQLRLPMPTSITFSGNADYPGITLRLDEGQRDGVTAWAGHLGLDDEGDHTFDGDERVAGRAWVRVAASRRDYDGPIWLNYSHVRVWCSYPVPDEAASGGTQS